jgi:RNA polymerase sigma factor (sigma-70 family)
MPPDEDEPPQSEQRLAVRDPLPTNVVPPTGIDVAAAHAILKRPETRKFVKSRIKGRVPSAHVEDLVQETLREAFEALGKSPPDRLEAMDAWLSTIARRVVADFLTKRNRRKEYEGPMPPEQGDEGDDQTTHDDGSEVEPPKVPTELVSDPRESDDEEEAAVDGWLVRQWIARQVENNPRDRETFDILLDYAQGQKTYEEIANERGMTSTALRSRIFEFKRRYVPRYKRWRNRALVWVFVGGAMAIVAAILLWLLLRPPEIGPDPSKVPPRRAPLPSATVSAPPPFEPAEPPQPPVRDMKPRQ